MTVRRRIMYVLAVIQSRASMPALDIGTVNSSITQFRGVGAVVLAVYVAFVTLCCVIVLTVRCKSKRSNSATRRGSDIERPHFSIAMPQSM